MTSVEALKDACFAARRYRYIPDEITVDGMTVPVDVWDTISEFETRQGGDCDAFAIFGIQAAHRKAPGQFYFVAGEVLQRGQWGGHAWVELIEDGVCWWADPTWGEPPQSKESLGYPDKRHPIKRWHYAGAGHFDIEENYA